MLKVEDILKATGGELVKGNKETRINGFSIDSRTIKSGNLFIAIKGERFDGHDFIQDTFSKGVKAVVCKYIVPNLKLPNNTSLVRVRDTVKALGDIANYNRNKFNIPVIAITGSNGKTTTKDMIHHVLSAKFSVLSNQGTRNNNIGLPLTLLELKNSHDICVLEIGTNHFGEVDNLAKIAKANIGIITNIGHSHLEFLKNLEGVFSEKVSLIQELVSPAIALVNADDPLLKRCKTIFKDNFIFTFGIKNKSEFRASNIRLSGRKIEFLINGFKVTLNTLGFQNVYNALACIGTARIFGLDYKTIIGYLRDFDFPKGRLKFIELGNINFIDDTYNSNPLSLNYALDTLKNLKISGRKILIMGDMLELGGLSEDFHRKMGQKISRICDCLITVGRLARLAAEEIKSERIHKDHVFICDSTAQAKDVLFNCLVPNKNDIVLVKGSRRLMLEEILYK